jgi:hypothetical protein
VDWPGSGYLFRGREFDVVTRQFPPALFGTMSLANPVLGFIGVARIRTICVGVHHAVPFPAHYLVVFCTCFHLASEHSRHRWGILIGQNRAQHPDLGFHVVVFRERLRIPSSSHQAKAAKAGMPIPGDDDVVMDSDAKQLADLVNLLGHVDIGPRWGGEARRVIVDEHAAGGV